MPAGDVRSLDAAAVHTQGSAAVGSGQAAARSPDAETVHSHVAAGRPPAAHSGALAARAAVRPEVGRSLGALPAAVHRTDEAAVPRTESVAAGPRRPAGQPSAHRTPDALEAGTS